MKVILVKMIVYDHVDSKQVETLLARANEAPANANDAMLLIYGVFDENGHMVEAGGAEDYDQTLEVSK